MSFAVAAATLTESLRLNRAPVAISFHESTPAGVKDYGKRAPAGCLFWQEASESTFATRQADHDLCSIGQYTHNLGFTPSSEKDLADALKVFASLDYVREQDLPSIPVLNAKPKVVVYGPLVTAQSTPDLVLLFVRADQQLILTEATQQVEGGMAPAMGRPACAIVPQAVNTQRAALSLGCCGARAYLDALTSDVALYAIPGAKLDEYVARIAALAAANQVLTNFHMLRRRQVEGGASPSVADSLAAMQG